MKYIETTVTFLSEYLTPQEVKDFLNHPIKSIAWLRLFEGYTEVETREILVSIYTHFPTRFPSIIEVKEICIHPIDCTKYQKEWNLMMETIKRSLTYDEMHNILVEKLSNEARLALKDIGGISGILNTESQYLSPSKFIAKCQKYKGQLQSGLVTPLESNLFEIKKPDFSCPPATSEPEYFGTVFFGFSNIYSKRHGIMPTSWIKTLTQQIHEAWDKWGDKTEDGVKAFKANFINNHPWLKNDTQKETF